MEWLPQVSNDADARVVQHGQADDPAAAMTVEVFQLAFNSMIAPPSINAPALVHFSPRPTMGIFSCAASTHTRRRTATALRALSSMPSGSGSLPVVVSAGTCSASGGAGRCTRAPNALGGLLRATWWSKPNSRSLYASRTRYNGYSTSGRLTSSSNACARRSSY